MKREKILAAMAACIICFVVIGVSSATGNGRPDTAGQQNPNQTAETADSLRMEELCEGDVITFGSYEQDNDETNGKEPIEWIVLTKEKERVLLLSRYALDCQPFHSDFSDITWDRCTLRSWLNADFYQEAFSKEERDIIQSRTVTADKNPRYFMPTGNDTQDYIFLLSIVEIEQYLKTDKERECTATEYTRAQGAFVVDGKCWWWTRSAGDLSNDTAIVFTDGKIGYKGDDVNYTLDAVRPALWIVAVDKLSCI